MNLSYWEIKQWFTDVDFCIVGGGLVGLNCALSLRIKYPNAKIIVLEKGILPQGASTKNAGFACFGSLSELLNDLNTLTEEEMVGLVKKRAVGLYLLRKILGDEALGYKDHGGYELFLKGNPEFFEACLENRERINNLLKPHFKKDVFEVKKNAFGFKKIQDHYIYNNCEGQIDTGKMMDALIAKCMKRGIKILNSTPVDSFQDQGNNVLVKTGICEFKPRKLFITTNGFASELVNNEVMPARAQVLITKPIKDLHIKGNFHFDSGYYYFRNIDNRILFGGGRNLDFKGETTTEFGETKLIQNNLEEYLKTVILPGTPFEIEHRWSGIMGVGNTKYPIIKPLSGNVFCGVRLGGMGVAIGSLVGHELAGLV